MKVVGITGSLGMGKSTIARMLKMLSFPVFDADLEVALLLAHDARIIDLVASSFQGVVDEGVVRRGLLADKIYQDPAALDTLEQILHPEIRRSCNSFINTQKEAQSPLVFLDIPLLYEKGFYSLCNFVWVAWCDLDIRAQRVMKRSSMTLDRIEKISQTQMSDDKKKARADMIIDTSTTKVSTFRQVKEALYMVCTTQKDD